MVDLPPRVRFVLAAALTAVGLALTIGLPVYYWWWLPLDPAYSDPQNINMFFGGFGSLVGIAIAATGGTDFYKGIQDRRRFKELVEGKKKSELTKAMGELEALARRLPKPYRRRLAEVKERHGLD